MSEPIVFLPLTQGKVAIIDFADMELVGRFKWHAHKHNSGTFYVARSICYPRNGKKQKTKLVYLHRDVLQLPANVKVDHIDGDGLNNRRFNLRAASSQQNSRGFRRRAKSFASRFRGVSRSTSGGWRAQIRLSTFDNQTWLGVFKTQKQAAIAYDNAARKNFGDFAHLNFP